MEKGVRWIRDRVQPFLSRQRYQEIPDNTQTQSDTELFRFDRPKPAFNFSLNRERAQSPLAKACQATEDNTLLGYLPKASTTTTTTTITTTTDFIDDGVKSQHPGWIAGVYLCAKAAAVVLLINVIFMAVAGGLARNHPTSLHFSSSQVFYEGRCALAKRWDVALHLVINVLGTGMLGASNYCMQSLVAPTREEVDACHARGKWLDIGTASVRNLFSIGRARLLLWLVLVVTATPFHLLYNSMVFESLGTNEFSIIIGPNDLSSENVMSLTSPALNECFVPSSGDGILGREIGNMTWGEYSSAIARGGYTRLSLDECQVILDDNNAAGTKALTVLVKELSVQDGGDKAVLATGQSGGFPDSNSDLALIPTVEGQIVNGIMFSNASVASDQTFHCTNRYLAVYTNEAVSYTAQECLEIPADERCQLLFSPPICIVVALSAMIKVIAMFYAARISRSRSEPLLTVGDAVASFLTRPDPTTVGLCWMSKKDVHQGSWKLARGLDDSSETSSQGFGVTDPYNGLSYRILKRPRWYIQVPSKKRWGATCFLCLACIGTAAGLFQAGVLRATGDQKRLGADLLGQWWHQGFDADSYSVIGIHVPMTMLGSVVIANIPQLVITLSYYCYNNLVTDMLAAGEYNSYGATRKPLRVTRPVKGSQQRSTYWLSVPYKYGVPMLVIYMILHWLVSQSIYYILVIPYNIRGNIDYLSMVNSLGYSPLPVFLAILVGSLMLCILAGLACKRFRSDMPLAGACSAAISAACHPPKDENLGTASLGPVQWGQIMGSPDWAVHGFRNEIDDEKGHCSFTALDTVKPTLTKLYA